MNQKKPPSVIGVFRTGPEAKLALDELFYHDFTEEEVGLITRDQGVEQQGETSTTLTEKSATAGAVAGTLTGGTVGLAAGILAVNLIPGIGQVITGGVLTAILTATALGAAGGNLIGPFIGMGLNDEEARACDRDFQTGRSLVMVHTPDRATEAAEILKARGAMRVEVRGTGSRVSVSPQS